MTKTLALQNGRKIADIQRDGTGHADLYRTITAGPSGQRDDLLVGRVRYLPDGPDDFEIVDMTGVDRGSRAGYARYDSTVGGWSIYDQQPDTGAVTWLGWASSPAVGVDVLINGAHAALGRHDSRRISPGWMTKDRDEAKRRA